MKNKSLASWLFLCCLCFMACQQAKDTTKAKEKKEAPKVGVQHPDWSKNLGIYEVNIRQYSKEGTLKKVEEDLPRIKELGVGILWLMPIYPISEKNRKGSMGSYYAVQDYKAVNPEFGTMDDLKSFVNKAHELGMYVILDWVANHTGWDHKWMEENPEYYTKDSTGNMMVPEGTDWTDVADLNYENEDLRKAMTDALTFWVREANVDGYRCDVAGMVPIDFWDNVRVELDKIKPVFMLAEDEGPIMHKAAFDMTYGWHLHHIMNEVAQGKKTVAEIDKYVAEDMGKFKPDDYRMLFTTNHDENSWNGTVFERMGAGAEAFAVLACTFPGMPLIYSGQEAGMDKRLKFFEKDEIEWKEHPMFDLFQQLLALKKRNAALWNGEAGGDFTRLKTGQDEHVFAFTRQKGENRVLVVLNLSEEAQNIDVLGVNGNYKDILGGGEHVITDEWQITLPAWGYKVYELE
ncbi:MAG: alpha-amylase family glycosyl hydrolase [Flammeovirgaceae bacterium]